MSDLLILRPQPGADETAARAAAMVLSAIIAPLFEIVSVAWDAPDPSRHDAIVLTSAQAARYAGPDLRRFAGLPCYVVGSATAQAARAAGITTVRIGPSDADALAEMMSAHGIARALHLAGRDHRAWPASGPVSDLCTVYSSEPVPALPAAARTALDAGAITLLHSPRAARRFATLVDRPMVSIATISLATTAAAGDGWRHVVTAPRPRDTALLAVAAKLCQDARPGRRMSGNGD